MKNEKICILTTVHPPLDIRIFYKEAKTLIKADYDVTLIAQNDRNEIINSVKIIPLPKTEKRIYRMFGLTFKVFRIALKQKADVYHFHDPELILVGVLLKLFTGEKVIYDVHEDLPSQILNKDWIHPWLRPIVAKGAVFAECLGAKFFDGIIAVTPTIAKRFPSFKTITVQNFPILNELVHPTFTPYQKRQSVLAYMGGITVIRGAKEMVQAVNLLPENLGAKLWLAGSFSPDGLEKNINQLDGSDRVKFFGWKSRQEVAAMLGEAKVGLVLFHPAPNHIMAQPNKLFEYMSAGIPIVASDFPLWREILEGTGCGLLVDPLDPKTIADAIRWLLEHPEEAEAMGLRGQAAVCERYNWDLEAEKLCSFYKDILR